MAGNENAEKQRLGIKELLQGIGVIVAILVAGTSLLSNIGNVPSWWFVSSLLVLIALTFFVPSVIFFKTISKRVGTIILKRERNEIAKKYLDEFRDLIKNGKYETLEIFNVLTKLRQEFEPKIEEKMGLLPIYLIQTYSRTKVEYLWNSLINDLETFNEITLRGLNLSAQQFKTILYICTENIKIASIFAIEIKKEYEIPDHVEKEFEAFREKHNDFMKDCKTLFHKLNRELDEIIISEGSFEYAQKW